MKDFVAYIIKNLVDHPEKIKVNEVRGSHTLIIEVTVDASEMGRIIGKQGRNIQAIRTLIASVAARNGVHVTLELLEAPVAEIAS